MDACLELGGDGVLVHVGVVLVDALEDEPVALGLHPRGDERRQVQPRAAVQQQLVVDDLVRRVLGDGLLPQLVPARMPSPHEMKTPARCSQRMIDRSEFRRRRRRRSTSGAAPGRISRRRRRPTRRRHRRAPEHASEPSLSTLTARSGCLPGYKRLLLLFD